MNKTFLSLAAASALLFSLAPAGVAAPQDYQVTGPILSMTDTVIVVQKGGKENFEIAKDAALKPADGSELKVGDKVTVHYTMMAKSIETKGAKAPAKEKTATKAAPSASPAAQ